MDTKIAAVINFLSSGGLLYLFHIKKQNKIQLEEYRATKVSTPSSLIKDFQNPRFRENFTKSSDEPNEYTIKTFVEGYVECKNPIKSVLKEKIDLVYSHLYQREIRSNDILSTRDKDIWRNTFGGRNINSPIYFSLRDPHKSETCRIHCGQGTDAIGGLEKIAEKTKYKKLSWFEDLFVNVGKILELFSLIVRDTSFLPGMTIGWTETELGIAVGSALTVYGEVLYNNKDNTLLIDSPLFFLRDKSILLKKVRDDIINCQKWAYFLMIPATLSSVYLLKKAVNYYKYLKRVKEEENLSIANRSQIQNLEDDYKCIVCVDQPRNVILKPCMHFSLCMKCYNSLPNNVCPVCKKAVNAFVNVDLS